MQQFYRKYSNKKVTIDGYKFDSKAESKRYVYLKNLLELGVISELTLQPLFKLSGSFKVNNSSLLKKFSTIRGINYIADFQYKEKNLIVIEDVKGMKTPIYKIKLKLFLPKLKKDVVFREVMLKRTKVEQFEVKEYSIYTE